MWFVILFCLLLALVISPLILPNSKSRRAATAATGLEAVPVASGDGRSSPLTFVVGGAALIMATLLLLLLAAFLYGVFHWPAFVALREGDRLVTVFANLAIVCYAFPAFIRTKNRAFLAFGFAALTFAYGTLFSEMLTSRAIAPWRTTHSEAQWYLASRHIVSILGLILYAYAGISLARAAKTAGRSEPNE